MKSIEQVKEILGKLYQCKKDFTVTFTGSKDGRVNSFYSLNNEPIKVNGIKIDSKITGEININERNFEGVPNEDNLLLRAAIHELAHHINTTENENIGHDRQFSKIQDDLLSEALKQKLYNLDRSESLGKKIELAKEIARKIAALMRELSSCVNEIREDCKNEGVNASDIIRREIKISSSTESKLQKIAGLELPEDIKEDIGFEAQEAIARAKSEENRKEALDAFREGSSIFQIKQAAVPPVAKSIDDMEAAALLNEKQKIIERIKKLRLRLDEIDRIRRKKGYTKRGKKKKGEVSNIKRIKAG